MTYKKRSNRSDFETVAAHAYCDICTWRSTSAIYCIGDARRHTANTGHDTAIERTQYAKFKYIHESIVE